MDPSIVGLLDPWTLAPLYSCTLGRFDNWPFEFDFWIIGNLYNLTRGLLYSGTLVLLNVSTIGRFSLISGTFGICAIWHVDSRTLNWPVEMKLWVG